MSWALSESSPVSFEGAAIFLDPLDIPAELARAESRGSLPVIVAAPGPALRGRLSLLLEEAVEEALSRRGAFPPGIGAASSLDAALSDQLYRSRLLELRGITIALPSLEGIATLGGTLDAEDGAVLRFWLEATRSRPVRVLIDEANRRLKVHGPPEPFESLLRVPEPAEATPAPPPAVVPEVAESASAMELSEPTPAVVERDGALAFALPLSSDDESVESVAADDDDDAPTPLLSLPVAFEASRTAAPVVRELAEDALSSTVDEETRPFVRTRPTPALDPPAAAPAVAPEAPAVAPEEDAPAAKAAEEAPALDTVEAAPPHSEKSLPEPPRTAEPDVTPDAPPVRLEAKREPATVATEKPARPPEPKPRLEVPPLFPEAATSWTAWMRELESTRGPKPLAVVERTFVTSYVPLAHAVAEGIAEGRAAEVLTGWSRSFSQSYRDAFEALRVRGKRPTMVLDAPDLALRIARLHGARSVQLVLVDGMRFDLGLRIEQRVRALVGHEAVLAERLLLWSALPSTTAVQIDLIGRGAAGLAEPPSDREVDTFVARGRAASTPRRIKTGPRDLLKLDAVEARLSEVGPSTAERLDALADEAATALADLLGKQPPRTLLFAFGDHGFVLDPHDGGTAGARQGGSSPEEVLVPAFAWLAGGVH